MFTCPHKGLLAMVCHNYFISSQTETFHTPVRKRRSADTKDGPQANPYNDENQSSFETKVEINKTQTNHSYDYDYENFKSEYYQEEIHQNTTTENETSHEEYDEEQEPTTVINLNKTKHKNVTSANIPMENYCSVVLLFRIRVFECFFYGVSKEDDKITRRAARVIAFWMVLYTITAGYLWCTRGWCCCCCPCACCHPHSVIQDAKQFLTQNPPGEAHLNSKRKIFYKSSEYERDCFRALEKEVYNF